MKISKSQRSNIIFLVVLAFLIIPQTRQPIQVFLQKGLALFSPTTISEEKQSTLKNYDWELKDVNNKLFNLEEAKGKVVLINFWATWCPPCIAEMPSMHKLYTNYKEKIMFVFVSNESLKDINQFLDKNGYTFNVYSSRTAYPEIFNVTSIPRTFLLDKNGKIVIDKSGAANWNSDSVRKQIEELLTK